MLVNLECFWQGPDEFKTVQPDFKGHKAVTQTARIQAKHCSAAYANVLHRSQWCRAAVNMWWHVYTVTVCGTVHVNGAHYATLLLKYQPTLLSCAVLMMLCDVWTSPVSRNQGCILPPLQTKTLKMILRTLHPTIG